MTTGVEELEQEQTEQPEEAEQPDEGGEVEQQVEQAAEQADDSIEVTIGDEKPEETEKAPSWVRELRQRNRELEKRNRELERQQNPQAQAIGKKPELADFDFDAPKYEEALASWMARKAQADETQRKAEEAAAKKAQVFQTKLGEFGAKKAELKLADYEDAEARVLETFSLEQQAAIVRHGKKSALSVYALGKNPAKAKELAAISDLGDFIYALAELETQLKVTKRNAPPPPERTVTGTGTLSATTDSVLERLRTEAAKSGDFSKVMEYKRKKRA